VGGALRVVKQPRNPNKVRLERKQTKDLITMAVPKDTLQKYHNLQAEAMQHVEPYPEEEKQGRGIVMCAGGQSYFTCAWVCINVLRRLGCTLPIEMWHLGPTEMDEKMKSLVEPMGVKVVDAFKVAEKYPYKHDTRGGGWQTNVYSIRRSGFKEVLFLDADNVPVVDPTFLFDEPEYLRTSAVFWPDYGRLQPSRDIWEICQIPHRDECEFESGQIVIDTEKCWRELHLTAHLNEHANFYYEHVWGDKETYHMAWNMCGTEYSMPAKGIHRLNAVMCQHDFKGNRIFQHRNMDKWKLDGGNAKIKGFQMEDLCFSFIRDLRTKWDGKVGMAEPTTKAGKILASEMIRLGRFKYCRVGFDTRTIEFLPDGLIGHGSAALESRWYIRESGNAPEVCIFGNTPLTCALHKGEKNQLDGRWESHEKMPIELVPEKGEFNLAGTAPEMVTTVTAPPAPKPSAPFAVTSKTDVLLPTAPMPTASSAPFAQKPVEPAEPAVEKAPVQVIVDDEIPPLVKPPVFSYSRLCAEDLVGKMFVYVRVGHDSKRMIFHTNGKFAEGSHSLEKSWELTYADDTPIITVKDCEGVVTFSATRDIDGVWRGRWERYEQMAVMLVEV